MLELKGKPVCVKIQNELKNEVDQWKAQGIKPPHLVVILVGKDPASQVYVGHKVKACLEIGFTSEKIELSEHVSEYELLARIDALNANPEVDGVLIQLPLPKHLNERKMLERLSPQKDVDCLTQSNIGALVVGGALIKPCTPAGIIEIFKHYQLPLQGKKVAVIGRSLIVGTPLVHLLNQENATVTLFHSKSENLKEEIKLYDIVCVAIGKKEYFTDLDFKANAIVIDVGIHRDEVTQKLAGDVKASDVSANYLQAKTPVPGGVGPMTIAMLMKNTFAVAKVKRFA